MTDKKQESHRLETARAAGPPGIARRFMSTSPVDVTSPANVPVEGYPPKSRLARRVLAKAEKAAAALSAKRKGGGPHRSQEAKDRSSKGKGLSGAGGTEGSPSAPAPVGKPWLGLGIARSTYYRRMREQ